MMITMNHRLSLKMASTTKLYPHLNDPYGLDHDASALDAILAAKIERDDLKQVAGLTHKRWFGYRCLSPGQTMFVFVDRYRTIYRKRGYKHWNLKWTPNPSKWQEWNPAYVTGFFRASAIADSYGIPYDFYLNTLFSIAERQGWPKPPSPYALYGAQRVIDIKEAWENEKTERLIFTDDPRYKARHWTGAPFQQDYADHIFECASHRKSIRGVIHQIVAAKALPVSLLAKHYGVQRVKDALS